MEFFLGPQIQKKSIGDVVPKSKEVKAKNSFSNGKKQFKAVELPTSNEDLYRSSKLALYD